MELHRKILILVIIICFSYIIFRLIQKRRQLFAEKLRLDQQKPTESFESSESVELVEYNGSGKEGFDPTFGLLSSISLFATADSELAKMKAIAPSNIVNFNTSTSNLPICQYIIKSSYNTPFTGSWVSLDAIKYILSRGCRFIDIELYMVNGAVVVAQSTDHTNMTIGSKNTLLLDDVLNCIALNAFNAPSPNPQDPLFLQLRIKTIKPSKSTDPDIYKYTAMSIHKNLEKLIYTKNVRPWTKIGNLMGSIVLIIDKTVTDLSNYTPCTDAVECYNLGKYINMLAGQPALKTTKYNDLLDQATRPHIVIDDTLPLLQQRVNIQNLQIITPQIVSSTVNNPDASSIITNYGVQFICNQFYYNDYNLINYENLFSDNQSAFVSFAKFKAMD